MRQAWAPFLTKLGGGVVSRETASPLFVVLRSKFILRERELRHKARDSFHVKHWKAKVKYRIMNIEINE